MNEFMTALKQQSQDLGLDNKATRAVETMTQRNMSFQDFITHFEDIIIGSTFGCSEKSIWKNMLKCRISYNLRDIILSPSYVPTEYHAFVTYLRKKDAGIQEIRAALSSYPKTMYAPNTLSPGKKFTMSFKPVN